MQKYDNGAARKNNENVNGFDKTLHRQSFNIEGIKRLEQNTPFHDSYAKQLYPFIFQCIGESITNAQVSRIGQNVTLHRQ